MSDLFNVLKRILLDHSVAVKRAKEKAFTRKELSQYWYLFIIGTDPERQRQGLGGALLEYMKARARSDGRPLWLEASNPSARVLYLKHGFEEVEEIILGIGKVGLDGRAKKDGEGVKTWGMVWRPSLKEKVEVEG
jgi:GNAT superfamily N-acetyltransferase